MDKKNRLALVLVGSFGLTLLTGCSGGGGSGNANHSSGSTNTNTSSGSPSGSSCPQVSSPGAFTTDMTGTFTGGLGDFPTFAGSMTMFVNSSGIIESGVMSFPNGARIPWSPSTPWPAGNPGVRTGGSFVTCDVALPSGATETFQGQFEASTGIWRGTYGASALYPIVGGTSGSFELRKTGNALTAAAAPTKLKGTMFAAPGADQPFDVTVSLFCDDSATVMATGKDGEPIMIVGKQIRPKSPRRLEPPAAAHTPPPTVAPVAAGTGSSAP